MPYLQLHVSGLPVRQHVGSTTTEGVVAIPYAPDGLRLGRWYIHEPPWIDA